MCLNCNSSSNYCRTISISSPKGDKCLTILGEYDRNDLLINNKIYILGFNPNQNHVFLKHPDSNYLALKYFEIEGIDVIWDLDKIKIFGKTEGSENKLLSNSNVLFLGNLPEFKFKEFHNDTLIHSTYFFEFLYTNKYKSCNK